MVKGRAYKDHKSLIGSTLFKNTFCPIFCPIFKRLNVTCLVIVPFKLPHRSGTCAVPSAVPPGSKWNWRSVHMTLLYILQRKRRSEMK